MAESVSVRCPTCRREHTYAPPSYPCACGVAVRLPLLRGGVPTRIERRTWAGSWVSVRCTSCGTLDEWPQPEFGCVCGTMVRVPVASQPSDGGVGAVSGGRSTGRSAPRPSDTASEPPGTPGESGPERTVRPTGSAGEQPGSGRATTGEQPAARPAAERRPSRAPTRRPAFDPVTIRTAQDAKTAAAQYLRWLGFAEVRIAGNRPASGVDLRSPEVVAHVDPTTSPTTLRDIETLWLNGLNESATAVCFSLAGYSRDARQRADELALALFVLDLTGTPQPVNDPAEELIRATA
ncbi:hypothetical protein [Streptomyces oceani]|uniref:Restriction endonuclease type IV Mrr domain-containing protein n=1 Tax=Streptomyces oceani TaxID=1075402 RepID=A0A1E7KJX1_9ACTN|nr:hypothetical protein [Streptomyces oceani]OEV04302.1 hypothetical protein AN216_08945 [Streptomyces oceani]